jgi:NADP-dependent 3-hydroxy acid dehydrogenase YdfG
MAAQALAVNGAKVYIVGRTAEKLETVVDTYSKNIAGNIIASTADVSKKDSIAKLYEEISSKEDHLDVCEPVSRGVVMLITDPLHRF